MKLNYLIPLISSCLLGMGSATAQYSVTEVVTDFGGYWRSGNTSINPVKPNNSHNLLAFTFNSQRYSTGVNDNVLLSRGLGFRAGDFRALPMESITGAVNGNTKIGLGELYDGVANGPSNPRPENNIPKYLTDGIKGMDIGTCVANLPAGNMNFPITSIKSTAIGDGIPDLLITQTADPSINALDRYEFIDINGNRVGNAIDIVLVNILSVGNWTADFYDANSNPMNLQGGYIKTDRAMRLWAADFSSFGINASNISQIAYFRITLNGNSDVAFVAYNDNTIDIEHFSLPVTLTGFTAAVQSKSVVLNWKTSSEISSSKFVIETSTNGLSFIAVDSVPAAGYSHGTRAYQYALKTMATGNLYVRLKMIDENGTFSYSAVKQVTLSASNETIAVYPNPATSFTNIKHAPATGKERIQLYSVSGALINTVSVQAGTVQTKLALLNVTKGMYQVKMVSETSTQSFLVTVQ